MEFDSTHNIKRITQRSQRVITASTYRLELSLPFPSHFFKNFPKQKVQYTSETFGSPVSVLEDLAGAWK